MVKRREQQQNISLLDFETLQKLKFSPNGEQTAAPRNDVTAKKIVSGLFQNLSGLSEDWTKGVRKGGGLGIKPPLELDILRKLYYLRKGDYLFSHTFSC